MCAWLDIDFMDLEKTFRLEDGLPESLWSEVFDDEHNVGRKHQQSCCDSHNSRRKERWLVDNVGYGSYGAVEDVSMEDHKNGCQTARFHAQHSSDTMVRPDYDARKLTACRRVAKLGTQ